MFIKAFKIKTSTAIRGSDRRKIRAQVQTSFPKLDAEELSSLIPNKEEMTVTKISTHSGATATFYSVSGEPVFFEVDKRIFPTVYTLWKYPDMLLSFTTWPHVLEKFSGGAGLMLPGVILPPEGLESLDCFEKNTICCVKLKGNNAPVAVGLTTVSRKDLYEDGMRGKGVNILHVFTDSLWAHGSKTLLPQIDEPVDCNEEMLENDGEIQDDDKEMQEETEETPKDDVEAKAGVATTTEQSHADNEEKTKDESKMDTSNDLHIEDLQSMSIKDQELLSDEACASSCNVLNQSTNEHENSQATEEKLAPIPTTTEAMDELLGYCFFCAVLRLKENDLPLLTSAFFRNHMLPYSPDGKFLDLKKSSYKKLSKFLQSMQERGLIKIQEMSKGVDSVTAVHYGHEDLKSFKTSIDSLPPKPSNTTSTSTKEQQGPIIEEMVSVSGTMANLFATAGYGKGSVFTLSQARKFLTEYAKTNELVDKNNSRMVILDPLLTKALVNKNEDIGSLTWENLFTRVLNKMNSCYQITFPGQQTALLRKGKIDPLEIKIEQRMGNKKVTLVQNLDAYGIEPQEFAHKIQLKAACSTSVSQLPGKHKTPGMQVLVQGNQVQLVATVLLEDYKIPKKYISGLELLKSQKKKKK